LAVPLGEEDLGKALELDARVGIAACEQRRPVELLRERRRDRGRVDSDDLARLQPDRVADDQLAETRQTRVTHLRGPGTVKALLMYRLARTRFIVAAIRIAKTYRPGFRRRAGNPSDIVRALILPRAESTGFGRPEERLREIERLLVRALKIPARYVTSSSAPAEKCQLVRFLVTLPGMRQPTHGEITWPVCEQTGGPPRQVPCGWLSVCLTV